MLKRGIVSEVDNEAKTARVVIDGSIVSGVLRVLSDVPGLEVSDPVIMALLSPGYNDGVVLGKLGEADETSGSLIEEATVDADGNLLITFTDGTIQNAGHVQGPQGPAGE